MADIGRPAGYYDRSEGSGLRRAGGSVLNDRKCGAKISCAGGSWNIDIKDKFDFITAHRGLGLIRGLEFASSPSSVVSAAHEEGLIVISAGHNVIRFLPPLIITKEDVKEMEEKLTRALASYTS